MVALVTITFLWSYWPTLVQLFEAWRKEPDYAHGPLIVPLALYALWTRRDTLPVHALRWCWWGLGMLMACFALRYFGGLFYLEAADGWSILLWAAGICLLFGGWRFLLWAAPGIAFMVFMIPLPHKFEGAMRIPLQKIATSISSILLQCLGQPAMAEGTTIRIGEHQLHVAEACAGLRIFVTIIVLAVAYILIGRPKWWEKLVLVISIVPVALLSNSMRIVITGLLYQFVNTETGQRFSHDLAGMLMMGFAGGLFLLVMWYMSHLIQEVQPDSARSGSHSRAAPRGAT